MFYSKCPTDYIRVVTSGYAFMRFTQETSICYLCFLLLESSSNKALPVNRLSYSNPQLQSEAFGWDHIFKSMSQLCFHGLESCELYR